MKKILLLILVLTVYVTAKVIPFDKQAVQKIFQNDQSAVFLFTNDNEQSQSAQQAFQSWAETNPEGLVLTQSDKNDGLGFFDRLISFFGLNPQNLPIVFFLGQDGHKYLFDTDQITVETLTSFIEKVKAGTFPSFLKSAEPPEQNQGHVKVLVGKTFQDMVLKSDKEFLVKFYAPWCGHCKTLAPHFDEAAERLSNNPNIVIAKVDSTLNEVAEVEITGFPTLKFWKKDKTQPPINYDGGRTADEIIQWIKDHTEYEWVEQAKLENTEEL